MRLDLSSINKVHLIGIGGIGVSAVARLFLSQGKVVSGSDRQVDSPVVRELKKLGAKIYRGHRAAQIPAGVELVVYTPAVGPGNPEWAEAKRRGVPLLSYPEMLGRLTAGKYTIAVAGTHGKTTTTAMLAEIFQTAKLDPTVIVGSLLRPKNKEIAPTNLIVGRSNYFIVEACEYQRAFLNLSPRVLVITNIDADHLDYYRDLADIQNGFAALAAKLPTDGFLVCDKQDPRLKPVLLNTRCLTLDYRQMKGEFELPVPGEHNQRNAQAAVAAAKAVGVPERLACRALSRFRGPWRRLEFLGWTRTGAKIYDDYGHHPTEIRATLAALRRDLKPRLAGGRAARLLVIFQPHLYSRTRLLFREFTESFKEADQVLVLPIYAAREAKDKSISSRMLATTIPRAIYVPTFAAAIRLIDTTARRGDLVLTLGAGDVFVLAGRLRYNP